MLRYLIVTVLIVYAIATPIPQSTDGAAAASQAGTDDQKPDLEGRFGGGYYPGGLYFIFDYFFDFLSCICIF